MSRIVDPVPMAGSGDPRLALALTLAHEAGPDIFEAPDESIAAKVVMIIRSCGHGQTETWTAMPWERFEIVLPS